MRTIYRTVGDEQQVVYTPRRWKGDGARPVVILGLGSGSPWTHMLWGGAMQPVAKVVTDLGWAAACGTFGGDGFGNAVAMQRITDLVDYCQSPAVGAASGPVGLAGFSMGAQNMLVWAALNPARSRFVWATGPLVDVATIDGASELEAAYVGGWSEAAYGSTSNPKTLAAAGKYSGIPIELTYASDDPVIVPASVTAFAAATGARAQSVGAIGHDWVIPQHPTSIAALKTLIEEES